MMRNLIQKALECRPITYSMAFLLFFGGIISFFSLGQLEDPVFSVKSANVNTLYPGASPEEVELEVTDRLEQAIQEMPQVKNIYSISRAGQSLIKVDIKDQYWSDELPQVWDDLRKKVNDTIPKLPPGAQKPKVGDDFGFVYGFVLAVTGDGYSYRELEEYSKLLRKELGLIDGVARVDLWGVQEKVVYLEVSENEISELNISPNTFHSQMENQNIVVNAGNVDVETTRYRIAPSGEFSSPTEIGELLIRPRPDDVIYNAMTEERDIGEFSAVTDVLQKEASETIQLKNIGKVVNGYRDPPFTMMRYDGKPAVGIQIAGQEDANIVDVGERLQQKLAEMIPKFPIGIEVNKVAWQSDLVDDAVNGFLINLVEAIIIVMIVLIIPSGFRMGAIISIDLILTILGTFIVMAIMGIPLERMSLGALIIALGMMVDNSIVVSDNMVVKMRQGIERKKAAIDAAASNAFPLFAATIIAVMTFYPIYGSKASTGEYCRTLFIVVATSLLLSWIIAMLMTPLKCVDFLVDPPPSKEGDSGDEFNSTLYNRMRGILEKLIRVRFLTTAALFGLFILSFLGFGFVTQMFFPDSTRPQMMIDYWAPEGTRIQDISNEVGKLESKFLKSPYVSGITSFIGAGPPRFYLPVDPEKPFQNYAQMIVNFHDFEDIDTFIAEYQPWVNENLTGAMVRFRKYSVGPGDSWKFEMRVSGPGEANLGTLRKLGQTYLDIMKQSPYGIDWKTDMMNPVLKMVPEYSQKQGRWASVSRPDLANATLRSFDGLQVGLYRERDSLLPILLRNTDIERKELASNIDTVQIKPRYTTKSVPVSQVVTGVENQWENPLITRWDRRRSITIQGAPKEGVTFPTLKQSVIKQIDEVKLPPGYEIFWDGEQDSSTTAQQSLIPGAIPAVVLVFVFLILVFNAFKPIFIILLTLPFAFIGITFGLLVFNIPFGFMALLGAMSLIGMMNKNIVVLLDAANENVALGLDRYNAIVEASVSRARPVLLAAGTTILGMAPLLQDVFWISMAVTIMAGLAFGSLLTLIAVPVFYSIFYRVKIKKQGGGEKE